MSERRTRGHKQRQRRTRRERTDQDLALRDPTLGWMDVGGRRMFVVGYTPGGAPYGCYEDEFGEEDYP